MATSAMESIREAAQSRGLHGSVIETLDVRFEELTAPKQRFTRYQIPRWRIPDPDCNPADSEFVGRRKTCLHLLHPCTHEGALGHPEAT